MKYTLAFIAITVSLYVVFSSVFLYIPKQTLVAYGFQYSNPLAIITYSFLHVSPSHLIGNMVLFALIGFIAEKKLRLKDYLAIYFLAGAVGALIFAYFEPNTVLVGASAAVAGLMIPAILIDFKKAFLFMIVGFAALGLFIIPTVNSMIAGYQMSLDNQLIDLQDALIDTGVEKTQVDETLTETISEKQIFEELYQQGNISQEEYNSSVSVLNEQVQNLTEKSIEIEEQHNELLQQVGEVNKTKVVLDQGVDEEKRSRTNTAVHVAGSLVGLFYLAFFRRDIIWETESQVSELTRWFGKSKKSSKKAGHS